MNIKRKLSQIDIILGIAMLIAVVFSIASWYMVLRADPDLLPGKSFFGLGIEVFAQMLCPIIMVGMLSEKRVGIHGYALLILVSVMSFAIFTDTFNWYMECYMLMPGLHFACEILFIMLEYAASYLYMAYIIKELDLTGRIYVILEHITQIMTLAGMLIVIIMEVSSRFFFGVYENSDYYYTQYYGWIYLIPVLVMVMTFVIISIQKIVKRDKFLFLLYIVLPIAVTVAMEMHSLIEDRFDTLSPTCPMYTIVFVLIFEQIYMKRNQEVLEKENTISQQNTALMISQIQPHFLYNSLTTISNLCTKNPKEAEEATVLFARYLRMNLDSLKNFNPIPFNMELEHTKIYLELEKKRFGDKLNIEYDIQEKRFLLPALSLQPLAENAVKHGICMKEEPGHLKISTRAVNDDKRQGFELIIEDDGVGFDPSAPRPDDGRSHVGMDNVRDRLKSMSNAELSIVSAPGQGCTTTIYIPK